MELWEPITGFGLYRTYLNPLGAIILVIGLLALVIHLMRGEKSGAMTGGAAALVGLVPLIAGALNPPRRAPPIHDISTDTVNPPAFEVLDETRAEQEIHLSTADPTWPRPRQLPILISDSRVCKRAVTVADIHTVHMSGRFRPNPNFYTDLGCCSAVSGKRPVFESATFSPSDIGRTDLLDLRRIAALFSKGRVLLFAGSRMLSRKALKLELQQPNAATCSEG